MCVHALEAKFCVYTQCRVIDHKLPETYTHTCVHIHVYTYIYIYIKTNGIAGYKHGVVLYYEIFIKIFCTNLSLAFGYRKKLWSFWIWIRSISNIAIVCRTSAFNLKNAICLVFMINRNMSNDVMTRKHHISGPLWRVSYGGHRGGHRVIHQTKISNVEL